MSILLFGAPDAKGRCPLTFPKGMPLAQEREILEAFTTDEKMNGFIQTLFSLQSPFYICGAIQNMRVESIFKVLEAAAAVPWCDRSEALANALLKASFEEMLEEEKELAKSAERLWAHNFQQKLSQSRPYVKAVRKTGLFIKIPQAP